MVRSAADRRAFGEYSHEYSTTYVHRVLHRIPHRVLR